MGKGIEVLKVNRRADGKVLEVKIMTGPFQIDYAKQGKRIIKTGVIRYDKDISSGSDLHVPSHLFNPAFKVACGIFDS